MTTQADKRTAVETIESLRTELGRVIVGQKDLLDEVLLALVAGGHVLLEGVPGLGKTVLVKTLADCTGLTFSRVQFTPDLMPADITGSIILEETETGREFRFRRGPIFHSLVLADEINRATPKTQSALLEAMQEFQVTVGGEGHQLPRPFFVLATQNPIEMEGTYPLPEAQTDRFLVKLSVERPQPEELSEILRRTTGLKPPETERVLSAEDILELQTQATQVLVADPLLDYVARLVCATHPGSEDCPQSVAPFIRYGSSPRGAQALLKLGKARALSKGRDHLALEDVKALAKAVFRHRIHLSFEGETEGVTPDGIVETILEEVNFEKDMA
ncbi:MAG: MoxR family ATPase [Candidatus Eremiobacteraeota bacterium]|nr:MoxR family ATPase [Candidatus Eremiobacteraeota bacterium]